MEARSYSETNGGDGEWAALVEKAYHAARRGRIEELELHLARLRAADQLPSKTVGDELYAIARSVRQHPSYTPPASDSRAAV